MNRVIVAGSVAVAMLFAVRPAFAKEMDLVDTAVAAGQFKTLVTALKAADLVETLKGKGPFTVFAPTDDAFAKLPPGALDGLLKDKEQLKRVLLFHVVAGKVLASGAAKLSGAKMVEGSEVPIQSKEGKLMVGAATVTKGDVMASNGVIHIIDAVLMPPAK